MSTSDNNNEKVDDLPDGAAQTTRVARNIARSAVAQASLARATQLARIALAFGRVGRATRHDDGVRVESDTDHTVMLGLVACELAPPHLDRGHIAIFALVHDLAEVYAGDTQTLTITPEQMAAKRAREDAARVRLCNELGPSSWIANALAVYEQQRLPEARFVRLMDKVLPKLTHALNRCAAALPLTDRNGFSEAHTRQYNALRLEYPDFPAVLDLLAVSMAHAEAQWPETPPTDLAAPNTQQALPFIDMDEAMRRHAAHASNCDGACFDQAAKR